MDSLYKNSLIIEKMLLNEIDNFKSIGIEYLSEDDIKTLFKRINKKIKSKDTETIKYPTNREEQKEIFNELFSSLIMKTADSHPYSIFYIKGDSIYFEQEQAEEIFYLSSKHMVDYFMEKLNKDRYDTVEIINSLLQEEFGETNYISNDGIYTYDIEYKKYTNIIIPKTQYEIDNDIRLLENHLSKNGKIL